MNGHLHWWTDTCFQEQLPAFKNSHLHSRTATCIQEQLPHLRTAICIQEQPHAFKNSYLHWWTATCIDEQTPAFKNSYLHSRTVSCIQEQLPAFENSHLHSRVARQREFTEIWCKLISCGKSTCWYHAVTKINWATHYHLPHQMDQLTLHYCQRQTLCPIPWSASDKRM